MKEKRPKEKKAAPPQHADWITLAVLYVADKILLFACIGGIVAVYILDVLFFGSVGGSLWLVFVLVGLVVRSFVVSVGVVLEGLRRKPGVSVAGLTLRGLQLMCFVGVLLAPINFFAASHFQKTFEAEAIGEAANASTGSKESRIARLEKRRTDAAANRDAAIKASADTAAIIKDQVVGTSASDNQTLRALSETAAKAVADFTKTDSEISAQIDAIELERETVQTDAAEKEAMTFHTWPVFIWLGEQFPLTPLDEATGLHKPGSDIIYANWILFYLAILIEVCVLFALGAYTHVHPHFRGLMDSLKPKADAEAPIIPDQPAVDDTAPVPPPPAPTPPAPTPEELRAEHMRRIGAKGRASQQHTRDATADLVKVRVDDWRGRDPAKASLNGSGAEA